jgi:DNA-binding response OmpR family regulator
VVERRIALIIEDAPDICQLLCGTLQQSGFETTAATTGAEGLDLAASLSPDLVTLDLTLPDVDGIEVCRKLRTITDAYLIILTARAEEVDRLVGLELGADDYVTKPFSPRELRARVAAMFRRPRPLEAPAAEGRANVLEFGDLAVDIDGREVRLGGEPVELTRIEFDLLATFVSSPRRVWERDTLTRRIWRTEWPGDDHLVDVHIANLRRKLGDDARGGHWIRTVRGVGYRFGSP